MRGEQVHLTYDVTIYWCTVSVIKQCGAGKEKKPTKF
jgi:hypothetical protein